MYLFSVAQLPLLKGADFDEPYRKIEPKTLNKFGVTKDNGQVIYPYYVYNSHKVESQKVRAKSSVGKKIFPWRSRNPAVGLFGSQIFPPGGIRITITEGENDAMAVWQMNGDFL